MNIYHLIFSNNNQYRITRHAIFWFIWIGYYTLYSTYAMGDRLPIVNRFLSSLVEVSLSTTMDMTFCYAIIYFLLPRFLFNGKYISMILLWLLFCMIFIVVFELYLQQVVPVIRGRFKLPKPSRIKDYEYIFFSLFSQINMEGCMAAAIKLGKISFIKQKEIDLLKNEKIKLQTEKGNSAMQPAFLADIISRVELVVMQKPVDIPNVLRKINELLINVTYEHTNAKVSLLKEIKLVREYIELEQCTREEVIEVNLNISGNMESESIASFILLQCIENAFNKVSVLNVSNKKIDIKISVVNKMLEMLISWNKPMDTSTLIEGNNIILRNLNNRLKLIYPQSHEIRVLIEIEKIIVSLKIDLKGAII